MTQRTFLAQVGCHAYQGYLFGRPMALADFEAWAGPQCEGALAPA